MEEDENDLLFSADVEAAVDLDPVPPDIKPDTLLEY